MEQIERSLSNAENSSETDANTMGSTMDKSVDMDMSFSVVSDETLDMTKTKSIIEQENSGGGNPFGRKVRLPTQKEILWQKTHPKEEIIVR